MSAASTSRPTAGRRGIAARLLVAQALVLLAGALTSWVVASAVAPGIFHDHLRQAGVSHSSTEAQHVEEAFASALILALVVALLVSTGVALAVTWYFTHRVQRSFSAVAQSAEQIADGRFDVRLAGPGLGFEFDSLAGTVNRLAGRLEQVETTRRRMLADLAHEMRTPLATIDAHLEAVEDGVRQLDDATMTVLRGATSRLGRLANDMTAVSRAEEGGFQLVEKPLDLRNVARRAAAEAHDSFDAAGVRLFVEVPDSAIRVNGDFERLSQVLGNLLGNALTHTPRSGAVTVRVEGEKERARLVVADTGEGIDAEDLEHIFDRFFRADAARSVDRAGSGIGLTISRAIVEAHQGRLDAFSAGRGRGAQFVVDLPRWY